MTVYDQGGHGDGIGRLTSVTDAGGTLSRSYDQFGNRLTDARTTGTAKLTTTYSYDAANRIASITYPWGTVVSYVRDGRGFSRVRFFTTWEANEIPTCCCISCLRGRGVYLDR